MANKLQFLPLICFILFPITFIITYTIAVSYEHVNPFFTYISDTGTLSPESCWFTLLLSLTGVALGAVIWVRYKQIQSFYHGKKAGWMNRINSISMGLGLFSALGALVVAAFQETNVLSMHVVGAFMSFLGASIYFIFQAFFTFKMLPMFTNMTIAILRLVIGITCTILFIVTYVCGVLSFGGFPTTGNLLKWTGDEPGWTLRAVSVSCEWIMAGFIDLYILSFMLDFRKIRVKGPQVNCLVTSI